MKNRIFLFLSIFSFLLLWARCDTARRDWEQARAGNSLESYQLFIEKHPKNPYSERAGRRLESLHYRQARAEGTRNKDIGSKQSLEVHEAFIILETAGTYPLEKQLQAIAALGDARGIDLPKAMKYLTANLDHTDTNIVTLAVLILGKIGDKPVIPRLNQ